jgi:hypothetical protein
MEIWNREELYFDVWEQPLIKLTEKYAVSAVMLGKVCRKLHENFCHDCGSSPLSTLTMVAILRTHQFSHRV